MTMIRDFFLLMWRFFFFVCCASIPLHDVVGASQKETTAAVTKLSKEVKDLTVALKALQEKLDTTTKNLEKLKVLDASTYSELDTFSIMKMWIQENTQAIKDQFRHRMQDFLKGIEDIFLLFSFQEREDFSLTSYILKLCVCFLIGLLGLYAGRTLLQKRLKKYVLSVGPHGPYTWLMITLGFLGAIPLYIILSFITGEILESTGIEKNHTLQNLFIFLPFNMYLVWATFLGTKMVFSPSNPSKSFVPVNTRGAYFAAFWFRVAVITYSTGELILLFLAQFPLSDRMIKSIFDITGFCTALFIFQGLRVISDTFLPKTSQRARYYLTLCKWVVFLLMILWFFARATFYILFWPACLTIAGLSSLPLLQEKFKILYVKLLWKYRRHHMARKVFAQNRKLFDRLLRASFYVGLSFLWGGKIWNMHYSSLLLFLKKFLTMLVLSQFVRNAFNALLIFIIATFLARMGIRALKYYLEERYISTAPNNVFLSGRVKTLMSILKTILYILIWLPACSMMATQFYSDLNLSAIFTGVGAASFGLTFGVQSIIRDFITGFFIILENNLMLGDQVEIDGYIGVVEDLTIRTFKVRQDNGVLLTIPFGTLKIIGNRNRIFSAVVLNISIGYNDNVEEIQTLVEKAFALLKKSAMGKNVIGHLEVRGINEVTSYSMILQAKIKTFPNQQDNVRRAFTKILKGVFDEAGVEVPTPTYPIIKVAPSLTNTTLT